MRTLLALIPRLSLLASIAWVSSCATNQVEPLAPVPEVPTYVQIPHPGGLDLSDIQEIFHSPLAPKPEVLASCENDFRVLQERARTEEEVHRGAEELVELDPTKYHWCFYRKFISIEDEFRRRDLFIRDKQDMIVKAYSFLAPIARAYQDRFQDTRYLRWAIIHYRRMSEWSFYRKLEVTPEAKKRLAEIPENPFSRVRPESAAPSVLEKYGILPPQAAELERLPASKASAPAPVAEPAVKSAEEELAP